MFDTMVGCCIWMEPSIMRLYDVLKFVQDNQDESEYQDLINKLQVEIYRRLNP